MHEHNDTDMSKHGLQPIIRVRRGHGGCPWAVFASLECLYALRVGMKSRKRVHRELSEAMLGG